jgi:UDP-N-acetylmuramoyl-tripeptide--D-alanyl-D-alanine ligase
MKLDLASIAAILGGSLTPERASVVITGVSTDSRTVRPGDLFVPLRGPNYDGHDYIGQAVRGGAAACLSEEVIAGLAVPVVRVGNTMQAMGDLAAALRQDFDGPVVAVTGSSGKTTTKEMLAAVLSLTGSGLKTEGNFNNLIGLPLTLFRLQPEHRWAVLEMGMSARSEIARLTEIARPDVGIVTNVGPAHLEQLGSIEGVARAKGELYAALPAGGTAIVNTDDPQARQLPVANGVQRLLFGLTAEARVRAEEIRVDDCGVRFDLILPTGRWPVRLAVPGLHNVYNALAAAAAAHVLKVEGEAIVRGLEQFRSSPGRMTVTQLPGDILLLEDYYNANPMAMRAALASLADLPGNGRRLAVLGDMLELGAAAEDLHRQVGEAAAAVVDRLILLGALAAAVAAGARAGGLAADAVQVVESHEAAAELLQQWLHPGDRVLVKGSRGMTMEKICHLLRTDGAGNSTGH